jgi:hypothetical protein
LPSGDAPPRWPGGYPLAARSHCRVALVFRGRKVVIVRLGARAMANHLRAHGQHAEIVVLGRRVREVTDQLRSRAALRHGLDGHWLPNWEGSRKIALGAVVLMVFLGFFGYRYGLPWMAESAAHRVPASALDPLSYQLLATLDRLVLEPSALPGPTRGEVTMAFARLRLPRDSRVSLQFRRSDAIGANAFALPSGVIIVTDELVTLAQSRDEVVAVLAHEAATSSGAMACAT